MSTSHILFPTRQTHKSNFILYRVSHRVFCRTPLVKGEWRTFLQRLLLTNDHIFDRSAKIYNHALHRRVFTHYLLPTEVLSRSVQTVTFSHLCFVSLYPSLSGKPQAYCFIGPYLLCIYSIAYFFALCNWQIARNSQYFFVEKAEFLSLLQKSIYKSIFLW